MDDVTKANSNNHQPDIKNFQVLTEALCLKTQAKCCATPCYNCPYSPAYTGELRGSENWNSQVQGLLGKISIQNSPNSNFSKLPDASQIVDRIKQGYASRSEVKTYFSSN